jgi:tRNA dimethylallyltransferase
MKKLICIVGPTASGKTKVAIDIANHYNTCIINFDSRQFYQETSIGTAKPTPEELAAAPHHFVDCRSISADYNAGQFEREAIALLQEQYKTNDVVVCVGGSGFYLSTLLYGLNEMPSIDLKVRTELNELFKKEGLSAIQALLKEKDPVHYEVVDHHNHTRMIRALEVCISAGKPYTTFKVKKTAKRVFDPIIIGMDWEREKLYERINSRVDLMMDLGLLDEVKSLYQQKHLNALHTVGYTELFQHLDQETTLEEAVELIKRNTRRYAKKQVTWFNNQIKTNWISPNALDKMIDLIENN